MAQNSGTNHYEEEWVRQAMAASLHDDATAAAGAGQDPELQRVLRASADEAAAEEDAAERARRLERFGGGLSEDAALQQALRESAGIVEASAGVRRMMGPEGPLFPAGIANSGNSCFFNAMLQALFAATPVFRGALFQSDAELGSSGGVEAAAVLGLLRDVFAEMDMGLVDAIDAGDLYRRIFQRAEEADVSEQMQQLFELLGKGPGQVKAVFRELFSGDLYEHLREGKVRCVPLDFCQLDLCVTRPTSLERALEEHTLDVQGSISRRSYRLPPVLWLNLDRFVYDREKQRGRKLQVPLNFPEVLNAWMLVPPEAEWLGKIRRCAERREELREAMERNCQAVARCAAASGEGDVEEDLAKLVAEQEALAGELCGVEEAMTRHGTEQELLYRLHAVIVHRGRVDSGHYYTYARPPSSAIHGWCCLNDTSVSVCSTEDMRGVCEGAVGGGGVSEPPSAPSSPKRSSGPAAAAAAESAAPPACSSSSAAAGPASPCTAGPASFSSASPTGQGCAAGAGTGGAALAASSSAVAAPATSPAPWLPPPPSGVSVTAESAPKSGPMWVRANPELFPREVPGMGPELLGRIRAPGGSLEEKLQEVIESFRQSARHLESLQQVLRCRALQRLDEQANLGAGVQKEIREVIREGLYPEAFLTEYDGQLFPIHMEEIVPTHEYRLALEVHTGGAYWSSIQTQDDGNVRHKVETVSASSPVEGSSTIVSQFGGSQRGAVFVWRWQHVPDRGPYELPGWLGKALAAEGNDPLRKLQSELEAVRRWEQQVRQDTAQHIKQGTELKDPYIREVLRLWPSELDAQGFEQLKKCAWVEGLDPKLFVGKPVLVHHVHWDGNHSLVLHASIAKRHQEDPPKETDPPYRLTTSWYWANSGQTGAGHAHSAMEEEAVHTVSPAIAAPASTLERPATAGDMATLAPPSAGSSGLLRPATAPGGKVSRADDDP